MKIAIDFDDVLAASLEQFIAFYNNKFSKDISLDTFKGYTLHESIGMPEAEETELMNEYVKSSYFKEMKPKGGAQKVIERLQKKHTLVVVTSRSEADDKKNKVWLKKYFPFLKEIHYTRDASGKLYRTKADVCKDIHADILLEDNAHYAQDCIDAGIPVVLFDYPYNRNLKGKNVHRVKDWDDVLRFFTHESS
jgi:5'(3')-deoxyribonucleotidase